MEYYIGIDLGTSSVKILLVDGEGTIHSSVTREYPLLFPQPGWSEQRPEDWWEACLDGLKELLRDRDKEAVKGIALAGQMHGLVVLDEEDRVIRNAILWNDGRSGKQTEWLNREIGKKALQAFTGNIAFAGFTAPKLLWMREEEAENFARIRRIMLPKDYINYRLSGIHACDYSDASGMLLLDVKSRDWSSEMLEICGVRREQLPQLFESDACIGTLKPEVAEQLGLSPSVKLMAGAGDNAAAAVGTGTVKEGDCNISLGTSGTIFLSFRQYQPAPSEGIHAFAHAGGGWHLMGCMLSAAVCQQWFCQDILGTDAYAKEQAAIGEDKLGCNPVFFLPYLMGERSPMNDVKARGSFVGLSMNTGRPELLQAVLEGVAFAMRDSLEAIRASGVKVSRSRFCGGGAKSELWQRIFANVLNMPLELVKTEQGPGYGAAMLAMVGCGRFASAEEAAGTLVKVEKTVGPEAALAARYEEQYRKFRQLYPALKNVFQTL